MRKTKYPLFFILIFCFIGNAMATECVILLHGFGRSSFSLSRITSHLEENGYKTIAIDYPSRNYHIFQLAEQFILPKIKKALPNCSKVHFVGYSMGGIITRYILAHHPMPNLGRVVFLATPNQGVEIANSLGKYVWFQTIFGPAMKDLEVGSSFLQSLPQKIDYEAGVISGNFSINPITSLFLIPGEDDGTVSVNSTKIEGMKDHIIINTTHSLLLSNQNVIEEVEYFITNGNFQAKHLE